MNYYRFRDWRTGEVTSVWATEALMFVIPGTNESISRAEYETMKAFGIREAEIDPETNMLKSDSWRIE